MKKRQKLGQHFLKSNKIAQSLVKEAKLANKDVVLEIGTGKGILIPFLCPKAGKVISIESDKKLYQESKKKFSEYSNLELKHGDGFKNKDNFTVLVSNLPYSKSREAIEWLIQKKFSHAVIMVQKEFAGKLLTKTKKERKAITILANHALEIKKILDVNKNNFDPKPKIDSVVLKLKRKKTISKELIIAVNQLFSYRRKKIQNILKRFGIDNYSDKRIDELNGDEIIRIAKQITKK